jgi:hypothetical protein
MEGIGWPERLWQDFRYGARQLRLDPAVTGVAVLSLALGIGANTSIFQLVDAVRLRTLPVANPKELAVSRGLIAFLNTANNPVFVGLGID